MFKSQTDGGKGGSIILIIFILCVAALAGIFWIYSLKKEISGHEAVVSGLREEAVGLNMKINELQRPKDGVLYNGWLSLRGTELVNEYGQAIQLRGVSSHGIMWYPEYTNYRAMATVKESGANVFRAAMYTTEKKGYIENPGEAARTVKTAVENAIGANMYVIVDWHVLKEQNPNVYADEAALFFDEISRLYADEPGVIYEICNEPNGDTSWDDIKAYAKRVIPIIRGNSPKALILVGTPNFCIDIKDAADNPLPYENVMYTYHYYTEHDRGGYTGNISYALEKGCPVFVSEWGIGDVIKEDESGAIGNAGAFLDFLDADRISWVSWALSNKDESHSLISPGSARLSNWREDGSLTPYGEFVFNRLNGGNP